MNVHLVVEHLARQLAQANVVEIGGAADLDAALRGSLRLPAIYVVPISDRPRRPGESQAACAGGRLERYAVVMAVDQVRDATGGEALAELPGLRTAVYQALSAWMPDRLHDPMEFLGGQIIQFLGDGRLWWSDEYGYVNYGPI